MLELKEIALLDEIVNWDDAEKATDYLIFKLAQKSANHAKHFIEIISDVSSKQMFHYIKYGNKQAEAARWLIIQKSMKKEKHDITYFASMLPVCIALFPDGRENAYSDAMKIYFDEFVAMLLDKKIFSFDSNSDCVWAKNFGYYDYLKKIYDEEVKK